MWTLSLITPPEQEALDTSPGGEVYQHLRLEPELTPQDALIQLAAAAARQEGERISRRQFITATWELWLYSWPSSWEAAHDLPWWTAVGVGPYDYRNALPLPLPPLQSVTSVTYEDAAGAVQTWADTNYTVEAPAGPFGPRGRIYAKAGAAWPSGTNVKIRFKAGYGDAPDQVPAIFRSAMLLIVGEAYERRELATVGTFQSKSIRSAERIFFDNRAW